MAEPAEPLVESALLREKRAALATALKNQAVAKEREERFDRSRPYVDGVQVTVLDLAQIISKDFPRPFNPSSEQVDVFFAGIQDFLRDAGAYLFLYSLATRVETESGYGHKDDWKENLDRILQMDVARSGQQMAMSFVAWISTQNVLAYKYVLEVLAKHPVGNGQLAASADVKADSAWADLSEIAAVPEKQRRRRAKAFSEELQARLEATKPAEDVWRNFQGAIVDYREGAGRWRQIQEADEHLRKLWIDIAGLDPSTDRMTAILHHLDHSMIADGHNIEGMGGYSIGGLEGQIRLIEDNGGVLPTPPQPGKRITEPKRRGKARTNVAITKESLTAPSPLLIRTDFTSDELWAEIRDVAMSERPFVNGGDETAQANLQPIDDPLFDGLTAADLASLPWPDPETEEGPVYCFAVDKETIKHPEHPILALSLYMEKGQTFRLTPEAMALVEVNLSIANLGFEDFGTGPDGIEREA